MKDNKNYINKMKDNKNYINKMKDNKNYINKMKDNEHCMNNFYYKMGVYVINCDIHKQRLEKFTKYMKKAHVKFCREPCVNGKKFTEKKLCEFRKQKKLSPTADMTPIEISIFFSHLNVWKRIVKNNEDYALVCEDDTEVKVDFKKQVNKILKKLDENDIDFDILFLWNGNWMKTGRTRRKVLKVDSKITIQRETENFNAGAVSYIISSKFAKKLINNSLPIEEPVDIFLGEHSGDKFEILSVKMSYNDKKVCYVSPLFRIGKWVCGGEEGTGDTTQNYDQKSNDKIKCKK